MRRLIVDSGKWMAAEMSTVLCRMFGSRAEGRFGILMYHRVSPIPQGLTAPTWNVPPEVFRDQIENLLQRGYQVWPLRKVLKHCQRGQLIPEKVTAVTFDDGYENVYWNAWPVLRELHLPATVFVTTAYLDSCRPFPFDDWGLIHFGRAPAQTWRPLTWAECREMAVSGLIEVGTHSHTHRDFRGKPGAFQQDLRTSIELLKRRLGIQKVTFSFPWGSQHLGFVEGSLLETARKAGVLCALTAESRLVNPNRSPLGWGRLEATETDTGSTLTAKLEGWYNWMPVVKKLFLSFSPPPYLSRRDQPSPTDPESGHAAAARFGH